MKASGDLVGITVHTSPNVKFLIGMFIILMSLHPIQLVT
jgi:hypothetical protein